MDQQYSTKKQIGAGETLFREGDQGETGYYIESGALDVWVEREGERVSLAILRDGEFIGEMATVDGAPRSATATALNDCVLLEFNKKQIRNRIQEMDPVMRHLMMALVQRIRVTNSQISKEFGTRIEQPPQIPKQKAIQLSDIGDLALEVELMRALAFEEFVLFFQPIIDLRNGNLAGFEALIRWNHPTKGLVGPDEFIQLAEEHDLISNITYWCVRRACQMAPKFQMAALGNVENVNPLFVSVNISGKNIGCEAFAEWIEEVICSSDCLPQMLKLEVTETSLLKNMAVAKQTLGRMRELGVGIAIDDFGTGYSNLAYLNQIPMTSLKIDRSFVTGNLDDEINFKVVKLIMGLANELSVTTIAEGIESAHDLDQLKIMNCEYGQGYYFSKPLPFEDALDFVRIWGTTESATRRKEELVA